MLRLMRLALGLSLLAACGEQPVGMSSSQGETRHRDDGTPGSGDVRSAGAHEGGTGDAPVTPGTPPPVDTEQEQDDGKTGGDGTGVDGPVLPAPGNGTGSDTDTATNGGNAGSIVTPPVTPPVTAAVVAATCATGTQIVRQETLTFAERKDCRWGQDGNLSIRNGFIRAREEQSVAVPVPAGAILCDVELASETNRIHFDDFFALRVNGYVLAASKVLADALTSDTDGHKVWDWARIVDKPMADLGKYCGVTGCDLPEHDTAGTFALDMSLVDTAGADTMSAKLFAKLAHAPALTFTATATGDNDDDDCYHSGGRFALTLKYVTP